MEKGVKILIGSLFLFFIFLIYSNKNTNPKVTWKQTYLRKHKTPYGTYIIFNELTNLFENSKVKVINSPPYKFLKSNKQDGTYILINKNIIIENEELIQMKKFVAEGNNIFISSQNLSLDSLNISTSYLTQKSFSSKKHVQLINKNLGNKLYPFNRISPPIKFNKIDTTNSIVLGNVVYIDSIESNKKEINFIKLKYGEGYFYLHSFPEAFTNYFILDSINNEYTSGLLTYLGNPEVIFWDSYYKEGRIKITSPLHYIFNNKSLKWAYYMLILGTLIFIVFEGKRKQKAIPIIEPEKNMSLQFVRTIGNMYFEKSNHKEISDLMINFFMENIRTKHLLDTQIINTKFIQDLSAKTNKSQEEINKTLNIFKAIQAKPVVTKEELIDLKIIIESFKK